VPGSTALDIGAHIGSLTLPLARLVGPGGVVYAFEPQKKIYRELVKNLELNNIKNVIPLRFAVGAEDRVIDMTPTVGRDGTMRVGGGGDRAEMRTIDSFDFSNVSMMKIDVEGYELPVLKGAQRTIRMWHPAILIEIVQIDDVKAFFKQNGYSLSEVYYAGGLHYLALYYGL
jgi:FkbM family methyltransferase